MGEEEEVKGDRQQGEQEGAVRSNGKGKKKGKGRNRETRG